MARAKLDWATPLRGALTLCLFSALLSIALVLAGQYFRDRARTEFTAEQQRARAASTRYLAIDDDRRIIQRELPEFERLARAGIIGAERRLDWLEALRRAATSIALPKFSYRIDPQRPQQWTSPTWSGRQDLRASVMTIDLDLLHEDDLFDLFGMLDARGDGLYHVSHCVLDRLATAIDPESLQANIKAQCELNWFTIAVAVRPGS